MPKFRKKPVTIEAMLFEDNHSAEAILRWAGTPPIRADINPGTGIAYGLVITTLEGDMHVSPGDWVIRGVDGEFYPCKPGIFAKTYEPVD